MRFARIRTNGQIRYGLVEEDTIRLIQGDIADVWAASPASVALDSVTLLAPCQPSKIVAVGLNYAEHIEEMKHDNVPDDPVIFLKPATCVVGPGDPIVRPAISEQVDFEGELALIVKKECRNIQPEEAAEYILGYTILNDVTARDLQKKDGQWTRGKGFDTFSPIGPWIETEFDPTAPNALRSSLNGEVKQDSTTSMMIRNPAQLLSFISQVMTLLPGDVIATGTPAGVGPMQAGDTIVIEIEGIGKLSNPVVDEGAEQSPAIEGEAAQAPAETAPPAEEPKDAPPADAQPAGEAPAEKSKK